MAIGPLLVKDANTVTQPVGAQSDAATNLVPEHVPCVMVVPAPGQPAVAQPIGATQPLPVYDPGLPVSSDGGQVQTGNQSQLLFGGVVPTNGYAVANLSATEVLYINDFGLAVVATGPSLPVAPGTVWVTPNGYKPPGAVALTATTSGHPYSARRW